MKRSTLMILCACVLAAIVLFGVLKVILGALHLFGSVTNAILGIAVLLVLLILVLWMFLYAKKNK